LFNLLAGRFTDGRQRRILLPMAPEYIGYSDLGLSPGVFTARRPIIDRIGDHRFKYRIDFDALASAEDVGVICVSRPTNPTGNVLTDAEMRTLLQVAQTRDVPLIVDSAYGAPFPNIMFVPATPMFDDHTILCMSLSKLGLPGARTGIVVAAPKLIKAIASVNAIINLASGGFGPALAQRFVESGEITALGRNVIGPYYRERSQQALAWLDAALAGVDYRIHQPEGAIFLWLWFPGLPITSAELYERLKQRGVLVVSGHYFFPGLDEDWAHRHECIRVTYSQSPADVQRGIACIAEEVRRAFSSRRS
jgi:valine--pyruvate aminotransferase